MNHSYDAEYCNLDLRFDRRRIRDFISDLIEEGYSLYWNENEQHFIVAVRSGRKLIKLRFERSHQRYKLVGTYAIKDQKLGELLEKMINDTRGHAVVKRFKERQILIENIMFGEVIRTVEINGVDHKVVFQKQPAITTDSIMKALKSQRVEERIPVLRLEMDYELSRLHELLHQGSEEEVAACKARLADLRKEMLLTEM